MTALQRIALFILPVAFTLCTGSTFAKQESPEQRDFDTADMTKPSQQRLKELTEQLRKFYGDPTVNATLRHNDEEHMSTQPGDTARGVIFSESKGELRLDVHPCTGVVVMFHEPYVKRDTGVVTCNGVKYARTEVEQRGKERKGR